MKRLLSPIISGMAGGLIVLTGMIYLQEHQQARRTDTHFTSLEGRVEAVAPVPDHFSDAANIAMPAVVHISASESSAMARQRQQDRMNRRDPFSFFFGEDFFGGPRTREGKGSGVIISEDGYIVTNNHVVEFADQFEVTLHDDRKFKATMIGSDPRTDLAVLKIDSRDLPFLRFGNSGEVNVGEWVLAVGNPFDLTSTVTAGIVSAKGRNKIIRRNDAIEDFIQTDAVVNPGNSGGALVDTKGSLVGINTAIATATGYYAGYSFAIPAEIVRPVVDNIIEYGGPRGRLGVYVASIADYEAHEEVDLGVEQGLVITKVEEGGAAQYAGMLPNDIILEVDGVAITDSEILVELVNKHHIGDEILVVLSRKGKIQEVVVRLKA